MKREMRLSMDRTQQFLDGRRNGIKFAIEWLHRRALEMNDPHAQRILDSAAFCLGVDAKADACHQPVTETGVTVTQEGGNG